MTTLFEKIIAGDIPAEIIYRDDKLICFPDIKPAAPVHLLIVPIKPVPTTDDLADEDAALLGHMLLVARDMARQHGLAEGGYRLVINCRRDAGQEVPHLHLHLLGGRFLGEMVSPA